MGFGSGGLAIGSVMHGQEDLFTRAALLAEQVFIIDRLCEFDLFSRPRILGREQKGASNACFIVSSRPKFLGREKRVGLAS